MLSFNFIMAVADWYDREGIPPSFDLRRERMFYQALWHRPNIRRGDPTLP